MALRAASFLLRRTAGVCAAAGARRVLPAIPCMPRTALVGAMGAFPLPGVRTNTTQVSANEMRVGDLLEMEGNLWRVMKRDFSRTAQGRAYVQTELRHITEPLKREIRFRSEDMVDKAVLDSPGLFDILYAEGDRLTCMNINTFEQIEFSAELVGASRKFLHEGMRLNIESYKGHPALINLPLRCNAKVMSVDDNGNAVVSTAVEPDSGAGGAGPKALGEPFKVRVPKFVKAGDTVVIDTADGKYLSRE